MGMNWVQGSVHHGDGLQDARSMSPNPLQVDVSLYNSSVGSGKSDMNPYSGVYLQSAYLTATNHVDKDQKTITQLSGFKTPFVNTCSHGHNATLQGFHAKTPVMSSSVLGTKVDSSSVQNREHLLEMQQTPILSSQGGVTLDPLEEKILYHTDNNAQDSSFGRNDNEIGSSGFTLSGLMQCALAEESGPLDGNSSDQVPDVHSLTTSLENACTNSSWMKRSCLASSSSVHPISNLHDFPQDAYSANKSGITGASEMSGTGYVQGQAHMQEANNSSPPSQPRDISTGDFCMNTPIGQHQLTGATNKVPLMFAMVQQKPSEVYNAPTNVLFEGSSSSYFSKSSFDIYQNSAIVGQSQHSELSMGYLKIDDGPDGTAGKMLQEENSRPNMVQNFEPSIKSNLEHATTEETGKSLCLRSFPQFPSGLVSIGETCSNACHPDNEPNNSAMQYLDALRPKKRKSTTFLQAPWHTVVLQVSDMSQSISLSEQKWALATNRLLEKVEDKVGASEPIPSSKRRLILSTQLMQQLLPPPPSFTLSGNTAVFNETMLYFVTRIALGEACNISRYRLNSLQSHSDTSKKICEATKKASDKDQQYAQAGKMFVEKIQKRESDFQRLDKTTSIVDIIVEIQDLERFSVINRFAKFHTRVQAASPAMSKSVPQRYVTGLLMPKALPEGVHCLPL